MAALCCGRARRLGRDRPRARLVIRGNGSEKPQVAAQVAADGLDNVSFEPLVPVQQLPEALAMAAVHVVPQLPEGADAAVPSKIFNVLAVGRPVVAAAHPGTPLADLAEATPAVLAVPPGDPGPFAAEVTDCSPSQTSASSAAEPGWSTRVGTPPGRRRSTATLSC